MYKTYDQIVSEMQQDMIASGSLATDFTDGSQIQTMIQVASRALYSPWYMLEQLVELFFVMTTDGPFLDLRVEERGVTRKPGVASAGNITFTRTTASPVGTLVPSGTVFSTLDGLVEVTTTADDNLAVGWETGQASVNGTAVGVLGNLAAGTALQVAGPSVTGLQTIAVGPGALTGGVDAETDDQMRARYLQVVQNPVDGGTAADYKIWADEVTGITNVSVFPLARGNGTVDIVVSNGGIPDAATVTSVQNVINTNRPVGADAQAKAPTAHPVDVTITVTPATGYLFATVQTSVTQAIQNYLSTVPIGGTVRIAAIQDVAYRTTGVLDCTLTAPAANVVLGTEELATAGIITVNQGA